jgi:formimidoylglutamate deiminase
MSRREGSGFDVLSTHIMQNLRLWFDEALVGDAWQRGVRCSIVDGVVARIDTNVVSVDGDERHGIGLPGVPNVHSHTFQRGMAGLSERRGPGDDSFWTWRETMYRFLERLTPDDVEAIAAQAFVEMLEAGFTRVGEFHYLHHDPQGHPYASVAETATRVGAAAVETGIGLTLLPCFYDHGDFGGAPAVPGQRRFLNDVDRFGRLLEASRALVPEVPGLVVGVAPHSLRAVAPAELEAIVAMAGESPVHIHVAEQIREVDASRAWSGRAPVEWLLEHAPVDGRWCLIHATHATPDELSAVAARGAVVGLCPISESSLGDGVFDGVTFRAAGGRVAVGTDSNVLIDAAGELRTLEYSQRLARRARNVLAAGPGASTGRTLFDAVVAGGARALAHGTGQLREGEPADLIALDASHPALASRTGDARLDSWIVAARTSPIDAVWVRGRQLVAGGRHVRRDAVERRFTRVLSSLLA